MPNPLAVVISDANGKQLTIAGATAGTQIAGPTPVVLCDQNGNALVLSAGGGGGTTNFADAEVPVGSNVTYTLAHPPNPPSSLLLVSNGLVLTAGGFDYTLSGSTITCVAPPGNLEAWYRY